MNKKHSKYIAAFDYIDKTLIVFSATSEGVSVICFVIVIGALAGIAGVSFALVFSLPTEIIKKVLQITRNKKRNITKFLY